MDLIFTKSTLPLSLLIRWGLKEPVSHFGIVFDNGIVFHSNLLGVGLDWYHHFEEHCEIVYRIKIPLGLEAEEQIYLKLLNTYTGAGYDFGAFAYFAYRAVLYRFLGKQMPRKNEWESKGKFLCTEMAGTLPSSILPESIINEDLGLVSPYQLYLQFQASKAAQNE